MPDNVVEAGAITRPVPCRDIANGQNDWPAKAQNAAVRWKHPEGMLRANREDENSRVRRRGLADIGLATW